MQNIIFLKMLLISQTFFLVRVQCDDIHSPNYILIGCAKTTLNSKQPKVMFSCHVCQLDSFPLVFNSVPLPCFLIVTKLFAPWNKLNTVSTT